MKKGREQVRALEAISMMLGARLNSQSAIGTDTVKGYLKAVVDCSIEAIEAACDAFLQGRVDGFNNDFAPTAARLAEEARKWDYGYRLIAENKAKRQELTSYPIGTLPPPPLVPLGPLSVDHGDGRIDLDRDGKISHAEKEALIARRPLATPRLKKMGDE